MRRLLFPLVVTAMFGYALATPSLDFARALGLPEAANVGLRPLSAIVLFYTLIAVLGRAFPYWFRWWAFAGARSAPRAAGDSSAGAGAR